MTESSQQEQNVLRQRIAPIPDGRVTLWMLEDKINELVMRVNQISHALSHSYIITVEEQKK